MLLVVKRGREREVEEIFEKWDLHAAHIGEVTADGLMRVRDRGTVVAEIPTARSPTRRRSTTVRCRRRRILRRCRRCRFRSTPSLSDPDALPRVAGVACDCQQEMGVPAVRSHGAHQHARAARDGRGRGSRERHEACACDVGGWQRPVSAISIPTGARCSRWPKPLATSRARAQSRLARPTA